MNKSKYKYFSLIELIVVISIIAATASFVVPLLSGTEDKAYHDTTTREMKEIQFAFKNLNKDCLLNENEFKECVKYGLWALFSNKHPVDPLKNIEVFSPGRMRGWRGKYMNFEDSVNIDPNALGQQLSTNSLSVNIPVIKDPYGGYYRLLCPTPFDLEKIVLICTGGNRKLETVSTNIDTNGNILPIGDDMLIKLIH